MSHFSIKYLLQLTVVVGSLIVSNFECISAQNLSTQRTVDSLIAVYGKSYPNDSARVDIIYKLGAISKQQEFGCGLCIQFLIEKIDARFIYGNGISELDQGKGKAAFSQLLGIVRDTSKRWSVLQALFNALKEKDRNDSFIRSVYALLNVMSNSLVAKEIVEFEISATGCDHNCRKAYPSYQKNLKSLLGKFE